MPQQEVSHVHECTHLLDAVLPDGAWFTEMQLMPIGAFPYPQ